MSTTYRIETRDRGVWTAEGIGDSRGWASVAAARAAIESLSALGDDWRDAEYRIVDESTGQVRSRRWTWPRAVPVP